VAFPIPADEAGAVAFNLAPGDRVDVVATFRLVPVKATADGEFRPRILDEDLFNRLRALGVEPGAAAQVAVVGPEQQVELPVSQLVLQNVEILSIGPFEPPRPSPGPTPGPRPGPEPTPTPPPRQRYITLIVDPQEALILQWLRESGAVVDLALRNPTDNQLVRTDPVTLGWLLQRIGITLPPPGRFGLAPDNMPGCPDQFAREPCR
jgi:Flp pilus assembly protein CpaB